MKRSLEKRIEAIEKRYSRLQWDDFVVLECPHVLGPEEKPPCGDCSLGYGKNRLCSRYVIPVRKA